MIWFIIDIKQSTDKDRFTILGTKHYFVKLIKHYNLKMSIFHCDIYTDMRTVLFCVVSNLLLRKECVGKQVSTCHIALQPTHHHQQPP